MDNESLKESFNNDNVYRATTNLNTAIENPDVTINDATDVNIQNFDNNYNQVVSNNSYMGNTINNNHDVGITLENNNQADNKSLNQFIPVDNQVDLKPDISAVNEEVSTLDSNLNVSYEPTIKNKKKPVKKVQVSKEVKAMAVIIFILLLFVLVIPYIYDFLKELGLIITT